jgi:O-antigen/teichoic acid export membrane protein
VADLEVIVEPAPATEAAARKASSARFVSNGSAMGAANLAGRGLGYVSIILMARKLPAADIGTYALLYTTGMLIELVANLGLDKLLMREIASGSSAVGKGLFRAALPIRLTMAALSAGVAWALVTTIFRNQLTMGPLTVAVFLSAIFPVVATRNCEAFLTAHERLVAIAVSQFAERFVMFVAAVLLVTGALSFSAMMCLAPLGALVRLGIVAHATGRMWIPNLAAERPQMGRMLKQSIELFVVELLALVYFRSDVFLMAKLRGLGDTGVYQIAYKVFDLCLSLFAGFLQAAFPRMARDRNRTSLKGNLLYGTLLLLVPMFLIIALRHTILSVFRHQYESGATALIWLMLTVPLVYINSTLANAAVVAGRVRVLGFLAAVLVSLNIGLDLFLIPRWSMNGAAFATFACEAVSILFIAPWLWATLDWERG